MYDVRFKMVVATGYVFFGGENLVTMSLAAVSTLLQSVQAHACFNN
jgi:hypothetical protein